MGEIYILRKKDINNSWETKGIYTTYKKAQDDFIYKNGIFRIDNIEINKYFLYLPKGAE